MSNDSFADKKNNRTPENGSSGVKYPHNIGVERSVLSAMLKEPACIDIAIEHLGTRSEVFFSQAHRIIFNVVLDMHKQKNEHIDVVSLAYHLANAKRLDEIGGEIFLAELYGEVATTVNLEGWCIILYDTFTLRQMITACSNSLHRCESPDVPVHQLVDESVGIEKTGNVLQRSCKCEDGDSGNHCLKALRNRFHSAVEGNELSCYHVNNDCDESNQ